jgi:hypothetical protein
VQGRKTRGDLLLPFLPVAEQFGHLWHFAFLGSVTEFNDEISFAEPTVICVELLLKHRLGCLRVITSILGVPIETVTPKFSNVDVVSNLISHNKPSF